MCSSPEVLELVQSNLSFREYISSFYECRYKDFFLTLLGPILEFLKNDFYFFPHSNFIVKEMRIKAYSQVLQSYKRVTLEALASAFGISAELMDKELFHWISSGRLNCTIDQVAGIVENSEKEILKNSQYVELVKVGDSLLNKIQRLGRLVSI